MKKHLTVSILLLALLALTLAACSIQPVTPAPATDATQTPSSEPVQTPAGAAVEPPGGMSEIVGSWQWTGFSDPKDGPSDVADPENYVITFNEDGSVDIKADCNKAQGAYTVNGSSIAIEIGPTTRAQCPPESRNDDFLKYLGSATVYQVDGDKLLIDLKADGGTMTFQRASESGSGEAGGTVGAALPPEVVARLDAYMQAFIYSDGHDFDEVAPGFILLLDTPQGRYVKAAGVSDMDANTPMNADDILEIGSITKTFTVVLLMQLQEEGVLSLDDPLSKWLPEWAEKVPYGDQMTLRQLANHTAGVADYGDDLLDAGVDDAALRRKHFTPEELVQYALDHGEPDFEPGAAGQWHYSNTGYVLLGMAIEKAAGKPLSDLMQERILDPLDLITATFIEDIPAEGEVTSRGYAFGSDNAIVDTTDWNASQGWAAGALAMNASDLLTFARALSSGALFQKPDTLSAMLDFNPDAMDGLLPYGLGVMDFSQAEDAEGFWGHTGETAGYTALLATNPDAGVTLVVLTNAKGFAVTDRLDAVTLLNPGE